MYLSHPKKNIRDTAAYLPLRSNNGRPKALRHIAAEILGVTIQDGEHCSVSIVTKLYCFFVDLHKAFNIVPREQLFDRLKS